MDRRKRRVHGVDDRRALRRCLVWQPRVVKAAAVDVVHQIERRANDAHVLAQQVHLRNRNARPLQRLLHCKFTFNRMGGLQQNAPRFAAQDIRPRWGIQTERRVGLTDGKAVHRDIAAEPRQTVINPIGDGGYIKIICHLFGVLHIFF